MMPPLRRLSLPVRSFVSLLVVIGLSMCTRPGYIWHFHSLRKNSEVGSSVSFFLKNYVKLYIKTFMESISLCKVGVKDMLEINTLLANFTLQLCIIILLLKAFQPVKQSLILLPFTFPGLFRDKVQICFFKCFPLLLRVGSCINISCLCRHVSQ